MEYKTSVISAWDINSAHIEITLVVLVCGGGEQALAMSNGAVSFLYRRFQPHDRQLEIQS